MPDNLPLQYFVSDQAEPIQPGNPLWGKPLPMDYRADRTSPYDSLTYGTYFKAVCDYLRKLGPSRLAEIASQIADRPINPGALSRLDIHLEKHGAFYHPARINLHVNAERIACLLNVAVSKLGRETIIKEFHHLKRLTLRYANSWLPRVFDCQPVAVDRQADVHMLLGEWFEDFHEFHLSKKNNPENPTIRVWNPGNPKQYLSTNQVRQIFEQVARILTAHYRIDTTEQIASWHHAAGDFVARVQSDRLEVRLITVRDYKALFNLSQPDDSLETVLNTALIFFLCICMKLRIDRLDGVGDMVWNSFDVVPSIIRGFFKGLEFQAEHKRISPELIDAYKMFFLNLPEKDIQEICREIAGRIDSQSPDLPVVCQNLDKHISTVINGLRRLATL